MEDKPIEELLELALDWVKQLNEKLVWYLEVQNHPELLARFNRVFESAMIHHLADQIHELQPVLRRKKKELPPADWPALGGFLRSLNGLREEPGHHPFLDQSEAANLLEATQKVWGNLAELIPGEEAPRTGAPPGTLAPSDVLTQEPPQPPTQAEPQDKPAARQAIRKPGRKRKAPTLDDYRKVMNENPNCIEWNSRQWGEMFNVTRQAIEKTEAWKTFCDFLKAQRRNRGTENGINDEA